MFHKYFFYSFLVFYFSPSWISSSYANLSAPVSREQRISLSIYFHERYVGEVWVSIKENTISSFERESFMKQMKLFLDSSIYQQLVDFLAAKSIVDAQVLKEFGIYSEIDLNFFRLGIKVPHHFLKPTSVSIARHDINADESYLKPSFLSGFINYNFNRSFSDNDQSAEKFSGNVNPTVSVGGYSLESFHILNDQEEWSRLETRVTKDDETRFVRYVGGDQIAPNHSLLDSYQFSGLSVNKEYSISPFYINRPLGEQTIFLDVPSTVEIFVNGILFRILTLEAGRHKIEDIPVNRGMNNVVIRVSDSSGRKRFVVLQSSFDESMLSPGNHQFSYNGGVITQPGETKLKYTGDSAATFFHRFGMSRTWTTGFFGQLRSNYHKIGHENVWATSRGIFLQEFALSQAIEEKKQGLASRQSYVWTCPCGLNGAATRFTFGHEYYSSDYLLRIFPAAFSSSDISQGLFAVMSSQLMDTLTFQLSGNMNFRDIDSEKSYQYTLGVNKSFFSDVYVSLSYQLIKAFGVDLGHGIQGQMLWTFDAGKTSVLNNYSKTDQGESQRFEVSHNRNKRVDNLFVRASATRQDELTDYGATFGYSFQEIIAALRVDYIDIQNRTKLTLSPSGSIAFAEDKWAFGQPIYSSHVLLHNKTGENFLVNGDVDNKEATLRPKGTAVLTVVQPYVPKSINILGDDQDSLGLSNKEYKVFPKYKQGTLISVGQESTKTIEGILQLSDGSPVKLVGGKLVSIEDGTEHTFFTGYTGKFMLDGIKPGNFQLTIFGEQTKTTNLNLSDLKKSRTNIGIIKLR